MGRGPRGRDGGGSGCAGGRDGCDGDGGGWDGGEGGCDGGGGGCDGAGADATGAGADAKGGAAGAARDPASSPICSVPLPRATLWAPAVTLSSKLLRTTVVQAFARTVADDSHRTGVTRRDGLPGFTPEPPSSMTLPDVGDVVGGHYKLVRLLGQGMFGKVYVAQRIDVPEHQVALKLLPRSLYAGRNVERELVMLATVGHPNVVQLKDHGTTPDYVWLTMPVYSGETLAERLEKKGTLTPRQAYDIFLPMARGLEALHAAGLRHQDVKPENIFLAVFGGRVHPILLDLGVAAERDATLRRRHRPLRRARAGRRRSRGCPRSSR